MKGKEGKKERRKRGKTVMVSRNSRPGIASYRCQIPDTRTDRHCHITHMGVRGRVQQAANGWLQPL